MLLYWGCEAKADAGQPQTLEQGKNPLLQRIEEVQGQDTVQPAAPSTTSTAWRPNREATGGFLLLGMDDELRSLPLKVSLVGDHLVRSNYSPEIRFSLAKTQDFLAPLNLSATPADSTAKLESLEGSGGGAPRALQQKRGNAGLLIPLPTSSIGPGLLYQEAYEESLEHFVLLAASVFPRPESHRRWHCRHHCHHQQKPSNE